MINLESTKNIEKSNEKNITNFDYINDSDKNNEAIINKILKNLKNEDKELCFPLLDYYFLNKNFKYQNLKESLEINQNVNEYINLRLLKKEIYPKDTFFQTEQRNREKVIYDKLKIKNRNMQADSCTTDVFNLEYKKYEKEKNYEKNEKINVPEGIPSFWKKDNIVGTFNPVYDARETIANDHNINSIPTIDVFYNSSKLLSIQTIFDPISNYISLLRLLPHFCLPLYDSGILQYVCEDPLLNPKLKGLELSYRLLVHDILFYAFFSYLSDLPFWAKPPIELLRIYNYESLYSFNDWESEHTERLVFHNIKNILYNFSDTLNRIELLYPQNYYITIFPNIYFKNIIDFLKNENFKLKKVVIVIEGKSYIDENMINNIKINLENFKGMTTENIKKDIYKKSSIDSNNEIKNTKEIIDAMKKCHASNENFSFDKYKYGSLNKKCDKIINEEEYNKETLKTGEICQDKNESNKIGKVKNISLVNQDSEKKYEFINSKELKTNYCYGKEERKKEFHENEEIFSNDDGNINSRDIAHITLNKFINVQKNDNKFYKYDEKDVNQSNKINVNSDQIKKNSLNCNALLGTYKDKNNEHYNDNIIKCDNTFEKKEENKSNNLKSIDNCNSKSYKLKNIDISDNYNIDSTVYNMYYNSNNCQKENMSIIENKKNHNKNDKYNSSESSCSEDESDDENIDGFFKSKKLRSTVYDKNDFSFSKFMNSIVHYEKIINYLNNDQQRQENKNSKIKFYVKLLLFEKSYSNHGMNENINLNEMDEASNVAPNERNGITNNDGFTFNNVNPITDQSNNNISIDISKENDNIEENKEGNNEKSNHDPFEDNSNTQANREENNLNNSISNSSDYISNLIRNLRSTYENSNFLSFNNNEENVEQNNFNLDNVQDSLTRVTFNFN